MSDEAEILVLFLDFDGVLNNERWLSGCRHDARLPYQSGDAEWDELLFDPVCVERVNRIVEKTGAKIVVSSLWREGVALTALRSLLSGSGLNGDVIGKTRDRCDNLEPRGIQINEWMTVGQELYGITVKRFVILDDEDTMGPLSPYLIHTSFKEGLIDDHVACAVKMLLGKTCEATDGVR